MQDLPYWILLFQSNPQQQRSHLEIFVTKKSRTDTCNNIKICRYPKLCFFTNQNWILCFFLNITNPQCYLIVKLFVKIFALFLCSNNVHNFPTWDKPVKSKCNLPIQPTLMSHKKWCIVKYPTLVHVVTFTCFLQHRQGTRSRFLRNSQNNLKPEATVKDTISCLYKINVELRST
jgi:hypothetical protein